jgi:hypothetical protein
MQLIQNDARPEATLGAILTTSGASARLGNAKQALVVGTSASDHTLRTIVVFVQREHIEPDYPEPRTIAEMAAEQRTFLASLPTDFVDVDFE